jgi:hypothetical protein
MFVPGDYPVFTTTDKVMMLSALKELTGCQRCGCVVPSRALDWHHVDGRKEGRGLALRSTARMVREVERCVVLCATCHRLAH